MHTEFSNGIFTATSIDIQYAKWEVRANNHEFGTISADGKLITFYPDRFVYQYLTQDNLIQLSALMSLINSQYELF